MDKKIATAINKQIQAELYSSYLYLSMAAFCQQQNFKGFASWLQQQAKEEVEHAMKFYNFLQDRDGTVVLLPIAQPPRDFGSPTKVFQLAYAHEKKVTKLIHSLYELAKQGKDYAFEQFLHWFIEEQVEEEANTSEIAAMLEKVGEKGNAIWMLDQKLGQRKE